MGFWTPEMDAKLRAALAAGMTASQAAEFIGEGHSRNAIIGRAGRIKAKMTPKKVSHQRTTHKPRKAKLKPSVRVAPNTIFVYDFGAKHMGDNLPDIRRHAPRPTLIKCTDADRSLVPINLTMMDLEADSCRWPVNDPPPRGEHLFCGHPKRFGSYCAAHAERSVGIGTRSEALADRMPIQRAA